MGKIVMSENVSLDGVIEDPAGDEGFKRGGWVGLLAGHEELARVALDEALGAEALLLGRRSYEWLAARWPSPEWRVGRQAQQPAEVRRVLHARGSHLEQLDGTEGRPCE